MNVTLSPKLKRLVEQKVKTGNYKNADDVIRDALRQMEQRDKAFDTLGSFEGTDIEALAFIVLMQATRDANEDIKELMKEIKAKNAAKQKLRELQKKVKCDIAYSSDQSRLRFSPAGMGSERAYHHVLIPILDPCAEGGVNFVETNLHQDRITEISTLESIREDIKEKLDSLSEMSEMEYLRLQMAMDRRSKLISTLSNILKKISQTSESITQNLK